LFLGNLQTQELKACDVTTRTEGQGKFPTLDRNALARFFHLQKIQNGSGLRRWSNRIQKGDNTHNSSDL
jgi:hypothetical protein